MHNRERQETVTNMSGNNLDVFRARVREHWQWLSDEQVAAIDGRREDLSRELQRTYSLSPEEAESEIRAFESGDENLLGAGSGRGPTESAREFGSGNERSHARRDDKHHLL